MRLLLPQLLTAIVIGAGATAVVDLWNLFLRRAFGIRSLDYCLLGRWVRHMPEGTFRHASIATVVFPFFVMQPSLGFGVASSRAPSPAAARLKSLATHTVFGVGLYFSALAVGWMA